MKQLKRDPVHRKIMKTRDDFIDNDDFDTDEALEAAIDKRKFLLKRLLKQYTFPEEEENNTMPSYSYQSF